MLVYISVFNRYEIYPLQAMQDGDSFQQINIGIRLLIFWFLIIRLNYLLSIIDFYTM